jgi:hypothetical protein
MEDPDATLLISDVAREVLFEIAPQEMPIFPAASRAYFADPQSALKQAQPKDDVLGFGVDALAVVVTPAVLYVLSKVFELLTGVAKKAIEDGLAKEISEVIRAMFKKFHSSRSEIPSVLTREHIGLIHSNVLQAAKKLRLPAQQAQALANAVTAQLVLPKE